MPKARFTEEAQLQLPLEYLTSASDDSLRNFALLQENHAANLEKELKVMRNERDRAHIMAELAYLLIENRLELLRRLGDHLQRVTESKSNAA